MIGFDPCGVVMDAGRFCYRAPCQFQIGGPVEEIHWYWASEGAAVYLQPHAFPRMAGYRQFKITDGVGERFVQFPRHVSGVAPPGVEDISVDGTRDQFLGLSVFGPIIWSNLPNCRLPVAFFDNIINIDAKTAVDPSTAGIELNAVATVRESGLIVIDLASERIKEGAVVELSFSGEPDFGNVLAIIAVYKTNAEQAGVEISAQSFDHAMRLGPEDAVINLIDLTALMSPLGGKEFETVTIDDSSTTLAETAAIEIDEEDGGIVPPIEQATILIDGVESNFAEGGGGGGGGIEGGATCADAVLCTIGTDIITHHSEDNTDRWFKYLVMPGNVFHVKLVSFSAGFRRVQVRDGTCTSSLFVIALEPSDGAGFCFTFTTDPSSDPDFALYLLDRGSNNNDPDPAHDVTFSVGFGPCP